MVRPWAAGLLLLAVLGNAAADPRTGVITRDLARYAYFQGDYPAALLTLRRLPAGDAVLEANALLDYGMPRHAEAVLGRAPAGAGEPALRHRAWLELADRHLRRGEADQAQAALARVAGGSGSAEAVRRGLLQARTFIAQGRLAEAAQVLASLPSDSNWTGYGYFNLGVAYAAGGDPDRALGALQRVAEVSSRDSEGRALADQARLAAGRIRLGQKDYTGAIEQFWQVHLDGPSAAPAMLAYGWAALRAEDYTEALRPWRRLSAGPRETAEVQESLLGITFALEKLGVRPQAYRAVERAIETYEWELRQLEQVIRSVADLRGPAAFRPYRDLEAKRGNAVSPEAAPGVYYLQALLPRRQFQDGLGHLDDLYALRRRLEVSRTNLPAWGELLKRRAARYASAGPGGAVAAFGPRLDALVRARDALARELGGVEASADPFALTDPRDRERLERIRRIRDAIEAGPAVSPAQRERLRRLQGVLIWNLHQALPSRLAAAQGRLKELNEAVAVAQRRFRRLSRQVAEAPAALAASRKAYKDAEKGFRPLLSDIDAAITDQEAALRGQIAGELKARSRQVKAYLAQARITLGRLYDGFIREGGMAE